MKFLSIDARQRSRRVALAVTFTVAPVSARMAGQRPVTPASVVTRKTALRPRAIAMFCRMFRIAARAATSATSVPPPIAILTSAARDAAIRMLATLVGGVIVARAVGAGPLRDEVLAACAAPLSLRESAR